MRILVSKSHQICERHIGAFLFICDVCIGLHETEIKSVRPYGYRPVRSLDCIRIKLIVKDIDLEIIHVIAEAVLESQDRIHSQILLFLTWLDLTGLSLGEKIFEPSLKELGIGGIHFCPIVQDGLNTNAGRTELGHKKIISLLIA